MRPTSLWNSVLRSCVGRRVPTSSGQQIGGTAVRSVPPALFAAMKPLRWLAALGLLLATAMPAVAQCPLSIATAINYAAGSTPRSVAVGDFNADGRPDLAVANFNSANVSVLLNTTPNAVVVSQQPASVSSCPSGIATFSVTATGNGPFTYQWQWQPAGPSTAWAALSDGINNNDQATPTFNVSGATAPSMNITSISGLGGNFRCIVTTACGSVTSDEATLTIDTCNPVACSIADLVGGDGNPPADGSVDGNDFQAFLNAFGGDNPLADIVGGDGNPPADGSVDGNDFQAFLNSFAAGC